MTEPIEILAPLAPPGSCEAVQWEVSQALDERRTIAEEATAHVESCPACAQFVRTWSEGEGGAIEVLSAVPAVDPGMAQRMSVRLWQTEVESAADGEFAPVRKASSGSAWRSIPGWVVLVAVVSLGWWMLDPRMGVPQHRTATTKAADTGQALDRQVQRLHGPMVAEKEALHQATVAGLARVQDVAGWSLAVLE